jgi:sulfopyruvate decarboxylase subunit beta
VKKADVITEIVRASGTTPTVFTTGYTSRLASHVDDKPGHFYMVGSMGLAACVAAGIATSTSRPAIVVDGDGALAMNPGALLFAAEFGTMPLVHIVLDDGAYSSTGGQRTPPVGDIESWAASLGYQVIEPPAADAVGELVADLLAGGVCGPRLLRLAVEPDGGDVPPRIDAALADHAERFRGHCQGLGEHAKRPVV